MRYHWYDQQKNRGVMTKQMISRWCFLILRDFYVPLIKIMKGDVRTGHPCARGCCPDGFPSHRDAMLQLYVHQGEIGEIRKHERGQLTLEKNRYHQNQSELSRFDKVKENIQTRYSNWHLNWMSSSKLINMTLAIDINSDQSWNQQKQQPIQRIRSYK